jgi:hypothetical protein
MYLGLTQLSHDLCMNKGFKPLVRERNCLSPSIVNQGNDGSINPYC